MKRLIFSLSYFFTALALLTSCINDDLSDCHRGVRVYFSYDSESSTTISSLDVSRVTLLAFDESGRYMGEWIDEAPVLSDDYYMTLPLDNGTYSFVAYFGLVTPYGLNPPASTAVVGETLLSDMRFKLDTRSDGAVTTTLPNLYHGIYEEFEITGSSTVQQVTLPVREMTNRINLTVEGLGDYTGDFSFRIDDKNGDYTLQNGFSSTRDVFYSTTCTRNTKDKTLKGTLKVLRLSRDRTYPVLSLREETSDKNYYEENLITLILALEKKIGSIDFARTHDYDIVLTFDAYLGVTVSINGWVLNEQTGPIS